MAPPVHEDCHPVLLEFPPGSRAYGFFQHSSDVSPFLSTPVTKSLCPIPQHFMSWLLPLSLLPSHYPLLLPLFFAHSKSYNCLSLSRLESHFLSISCIRYAALNPICCPAFSSSIVSSQHARVGHSGGEQNGLLPAVAVKLWVFFFLLLQYEALWLSEENFTENVRRCLTH